MHDTSAQAAKIQAAVHRTLSAERKMLIACEMSDAVREVARERIRARRPDLDEAAVTVELISELHGVRVQR